MFIQRATTFEFDIGKLLPADILDFFASAVVGQRKTNVIIEIANYFVDRPT